MFGKKAQKTQVKEKNKKRKLIVSEVQVRLHQQLRDVVHFVVLAIDTHQQLLGNGALQAARKEGPLAATERAVLASLALGSEPHDLAQHFFSFAVDGSSGLPHDGGEHVVCPLEVSVVLLVLGVLRVGFTRAVLRHVVLGEGAGDGHVDRERFVVLPIGDGHVAGA